MKPSEQVLEITKILVKQGEEKTMSIISAIMAVLDEMQKQIDNLKQDAI